MPFPANLPFSPLSSKNWNVWFPDMRAYLRANDYWGVCDGSEPVPLPIDPATSTPEEIKEWRLYEKRRNGAAGMIFLGLDDSQKVHVTGIDHNPQLMLDKLEGVHLQKRPAARFNAYDLLLSLRKEGEETLSSLLARADKCQQDIRALRPAGFLVENIDEELTCMALIRALGPDYDAFVSSLLIQTSGTLTLASIQSAFLNEEAQRRSRGTDDVTPNVHLANSTATLPMKPRCSFCDGANHTVAECHKFERAAREAKDTTRENRKQRRSMKERAAHASAEPAPDAAPPST